MGPCLQGARGYPCARVTLASELKLALVYKQITLIYQALLTVLMCFVMRDILCNVQDSK